MNITIEDYQTGWADASDAEKEAIASVLADFNPSIMNIKTLTSTTRPKRVSSNKHRRRR